MAKEVTLASISTQIERGFSAVAEDIGDLRRELKGDIAHLGEQLTSIESELRDIKRRLALLEESVDAMQGFAKEIDALSERVRAIEKHLGINKKIAA